MKVFIIEAGCISVGVWAEGEKTVDHEAHWIASVWYQYLRDTNCHSHAYNMPLMNDQKSVAKVQRNVTVYVKVCSVFMASIHKFNIYGQ